jgi:phage gpG-like protein
VGETDDAGLIGASSSAKAIVDRLQAQMERLRDFATPLQAAGNVVRDASVKRFTDNDWAPDAPSTIAKKGSSRPGIDTGALRNSIQVSPPDANSVSIGTNLKYARWFQEGTGIYAGHSEWTIRPKAGQALAFEGGDGIVIRRAVTAKGQPARPFLDRDLLDSVRPDITAIFESWIMRGTLP